MKEILTNQVKKAVMSLKTGKHESVTLQVLDIKSIGQKDSTAPEKYKVILSDGEYLINGFMGSSMKSLIAGKTIRKNTLIKILKYSIKLHGDACILIISSLDFSNLLHCEESYGTPHPFKYSSLDDVPTIESAPVSAPTTKTETEKNSKKMHISSISPFVSEWSICGVVVHKQPLRTWTNKTSGKSGTICTIAVKDSTGSIKVTGFDDAADRLDRNSKLGNVIYVSGGNIKASDNERFSFTSTQPNSQPMVCYQIILNQNSTLSVPNEQECEDVPEFEKNISPISELPEIYSANGDSGRVSLLVVVCHVEEFASMQTKAGNTLELTRTVVSDQSDAIPVVFWGTTHNDHLKKIRELKAEDPEKPVIIYLDNVKLSYFNDKISASATGASSILINPLWKDTEELVKWYSQLDKSAIEATATKPKNSRLEFDAYSSNISRSTIKQIQESSEDSMESVVKAHIPAIYYNSGSIYYHACPFNRDNGYPCLKKVEVLDAGENNVFYCYRCENSTPDPLFRYIGSFRIVDPLGEMYCRYYDEIGEKIIGMPASELALLEKEDLLKYGSVLSSVDPGPYLIKLKTFTDNYNGQLRKTSTIMGVSKVSIEKEIDFLLKDFE